jgi:hypothetical protein
LTDWFRFGFLPGAEFALFGQGGKLYWDAARSACQAQGGDLATLWSARENHAVSVVLSGLGTGLDQVWIGGCYNAEDTVLSWADGTPLNPAFSPLPFAVGEPTLTSGQDCLLLSVAGGTWLTKRINTNRGYVCRRAAATT